MSAGRHPGKRRRQTMARWGRRDAADPLPRRQASGGVCAPVRALPPWPDGPGKDRVRRGGTPRRPQPPPFVLHGPAGPRRVGRRPSVALGSRASPTPARSMAAAPPNWSVENGSTTIGTPQVSASVTLLLPPWVIARSARRRSVTCGRKPRANQWPGSSPSTAGSAEPMANATRTSRGRRAATTRASTSSRAERKLPKLTYTTGRGSSASSHSATSWCHALVRGQPNRGRHGVAGGWSGRRGAARPGS